MIRDYEIVDSENGIIRETRELRPARFLTEELVERLQKQKQELMSIKESIKEELLKRIYERVETLKVEHNTDVEIIDSPIQSIFEEGHIKAVDDELMFLDKLKSFVKSI